MIGRSLLAAALIALPQTVLAFENGQRWSCITDQGAAAFLAVHSVEGDRITYSWGQVDPETAEMMILCDMRNRLVLGEIRQFCRQLGDEPSPGHTALRAACQNSK